MDSRLLGFPFSGFWWIPQNPIFMQICKLSGDWSQSNALITYNLITAVVTSNSDDKPTKNGNLQPKEIKKIQSNWISVSAIQTLPWRRQWRMEHNGKESYFWGIFFMFFLLFLWCAHCWPIFRLATVRKWHFTLERRDAAWSISLMNTAG